MRSPHHRAWLVRLTLGLAVYLLLFSAFALYHAYANSELIDSRGCQIGEWVMHGQADVAAASCLIAGLVASSVVCFSYQSVPDRRVCCRLLARAPPGALSL
jgi:hypothetical protein